MPFAWFRNKRRERILAEPFPEAWMEIIDRKVRAVDGLSDAQLETLRDLVQVFIAEKSFEGCGGLTIDDTIRVVVAAQACILILGRDHDLYSDVLSILVYPSAYFVPRPKEVEGVVVKSERVHLGEAHLGGPVVLAWDATLQGAVNPSDGSNLVYHEFAHKLDMLTGRADGTPPLDSKARRLAWNQALTPVYAALRKESGAGRKTFLDAYGATSEAEFFAVATEFFFGKPRAFLRRHPEVYDVLKTFFDQDPARRRD